MVALIQTWLANAVINKLNILRVINSNTFGLGGIGFSVGIRLALIVHLLISVAHDDDGRYWPLGCIPFLGINGTSQLWSINV